jgi:aromatic ring hydroxylase
MGLRTADQFRAGLADGRSVFYRGRQVKDVVADPELSLAVDHSALCFSIAQTHPDLATADVDGELISAFYKLPRSRDDLILRGALIEEVSRQGGGTIVLKEVGSDAMFALLRATTGAGLENARAFYQRVCRDDLALAVAQTDVKGNRSLPPTGQTDPDLYLHIVDEDADSITVRGAKCHTSFSANADELIVLPTRAMGPGDADYAVSFAIPIDTAGLNLYVSPYSAGDRNEFDFPLSSRHKLLESLTVFDDVRVPKGRVFLNRQPELAGPVALAFVDYHRFTAINYKLPLLDILVGSAILVAEANGISKAAHIKAKITELITYAETVRGLAELAAFRSRPADQGVQQPDPLAVNMAKYHFAHGYTAAVATLIDLSGGILITGPGHEDWLNPDIRAVLEKYYAAAVPAERRLRILNFIADLTARDYGGYQMVLATHAEGSLEAEKLQIARSFDPVRAVQYVSALAGLDGDGATA